MTTAIKLIQNAKVGILETIKEELKECENKEIYFHDIVHGEVDAITPQNKKECLALIELSNVEHFDDGMIDRSSWDRTLITMAYLSIEDNLFNDDFMQYLQTELNNEVVSKLKAKEIIIKIERELKSLNLITTTNIYEDNQTQLFLSVNFKVDSIKEELKKRGFSNKQVIDLSDSIKIFTSNIKQGQNAVVIEQKRNDLIRVYLMDKDKDIDIRNLFKLQSISEETGFNLSPSAYIEQSTEKYEEDKLIRKKNYLNSFISVGDFVNQIVRISNRLTQKSMDVRK